MNILKQKHNNLVQKDRRIQLKKCLMKENSFVLTLFIEINKKNCRILSKILSAFAFKQKYIM